MKDEKESKRENFFVHLLTFDRTQSYKRQVKDIFKEWLYWTKECAIDLNSPNSSYCSESHFKNVTNGC